MGILALVLVYLLFTGGKYDLFTLGILTVAGLMLFLRPIKNVRWAALIALAVGLLASYYAYNAFHVSTIVLMIVFVAATLLLYLLFKFAEDLLGIIGGILSFPPIAVIIGVACVVQAILILMGQSLLVFIPPIRLWPFLRESRGTFKNGRTLCMDPGSEYAERILRGVLLDVDGSRVKDFMFTSG